MKGYNMFSHWFLLKQHWHHLVLDEYKIRIFKRTDQILNDYYSKWRALETDCHLGK